MNEGKVKLFADQEVNTGRQPFLAFTATLSGEARESVENSGRGDSYKDLVWGGLQAKLDF